MASPPVSFADIILSQQRELDSHWCVCVRVRVRVCVCVRVCVLNSLFSISISICSSQARKPLSCIQVYNTHTIHVQYINLSICVLTVFQIEQKAINQLEALYGCHDNPDEYITVRRHTSRPSHTPSHHHCTPRSHTHAPPTSPWHSL